MKTVELVIKEKKAASLINFLKQLDFVEVKSVTNSKATTKKTQPINPNNIISATTPNADISYLFGAWKNTPIDANDIRDSSRKKAQLVW